MYKKNGNRKYRLEIRVTRVELIKIIVQRKLFFSISEIRTSIFRRKQYIGTDALSNNYSA